MHPNLDAKAFFQQASNGTDATHSRSRRLMLSVLPRSSSACVFSKAPRRRYGNVPRSALSRATADRGEIAQRVLADHGVLRAKIQLTAQRGRHNSGAKRLNASDA